MKDLLLPNAVNQKDEKQHTAGLNDTAIPHVKIKITEIPLEKQVNTAVPEAPMCPSVKSTLTVMWLSDAIQNKLQYNTLRILQKLVKTCLGTISAALHTTYKK